MLIASDMNRIKALKFGVLAVCLGIPIAATIITKKLTREACTPGKPESSANFVACNSGQVCTRIDARGRTLCLPELPPAPIEFGSPYESGHPVRCVQGPRQGSHLNLNQLDAVDLTSDSKRVLAGADGTAYIFTGCKAGMDDCGYGFGNYVQIFESSRKYALLYAGLAEITVRNGYEVKKGDVIGVEGATAPESTQERRGALSSGEAPLASRLHWQVNLLEDENPKLETLEKPAWRTRTVPFRYTGQADCK